MEKKRINKYLSEVGFCSRRKADEYISAGRVYINGVKSVLGSKVNIDDEISVDGEIIQYKDKKKVYIAFNKPVGIECTGSEKVKDNIIDFINHKENSLNKVVISKLIKFDTNNYFCCSNHKLFIKPISDSVTEPLQSAIINSQGLIGQIVYDMNGIYEVMLLTDTRHSTPVFSENFYCNAKGSGKPGIITCIYSELIWDEQFEIGQKFYSSGLGGVFPKNILIGNVLNIKNISASEKEVVIKLEVNPITENLFGIVVSP